MSPPFMSEYKKSFALKRICQSFLGGLRLFSPPVFIALQVGLFTLPAIIFSATYFLLIDSQSSLLWKSVTIGLAICIADLILSIFIYALKRGSRTYVGPGPMFRRTSLLGEEDQIEYIGVLNFTTWNFVAPNVSAETRHLVAVLCSSLAFAVCTPIVISINQPVWLRSIGLFTLCNARYSSVLSLPPEISTFDAIHRRDLYYRPAYAIILGTASFLTICRTGEGNTTVQFYYLLGLCLLPLFWGAGILAPMDAFVPWLIETALKLLGGCPSFYYFGSLLALVITGTCSLLVFISAQHRLFSLVLQCAFGYLISIDLGAFISLKSKYIYESAIHFNQIIVPVVTFLVSLAAVAGSIITECICWTHIEGIIIGVCLTLSITASFSQRYTIRLNRRLPLSVTMAISFLEAIITVLLHTWLAAEAQGVERSESRLGTRELHHLLTYALTIRAFSVSILEPRSSCWDMSIATALRWSPSDSIFRTPEFTTLLFLVSFLRKRFICFGRFFGMISLIAHADAVTPLLDNKVRIAGCSLLALPISLFSLLLASIAEGFTMNPIFSLPIFLVGFSRPTSFWKGSWLPTKKSFLSLADHGLDSAIYFEIGPGLTRGFVRRAYASRMKLDRGACYIARYEDRLLFLRVLATGWNFVYIQVKGLEMQEKTSCHNQESAWLDELYDQKFGTRQTMKKCSLSRTMKTYLTIASPLLSIQVPTYSESKSTLSNLISSKEKLTLERMFFKAFAFLWIKRNPVIQAESSLRKRNSVNSASYSQSQLSSRDDSDSEASDSESLTNPGNDTPTLSISNSFFGHLTTHLNGTETSAYRATPETSIWTSRAPMTPFPRIPGMEVSRYGTGRPPTLWPDSFSMENKNNKRNSEDFTHLNVLWVQKCLGESLPTREVRRKIEKLVAKIWKLAIGENNEYEEIDLYQFFTEEFLANQVFQLKKLDRSNLTDIVIKAFRYAAKLCLDEIYNSTQIEDQQDPELSLTHLEETIIELNRFERDFQFCDQSELPKYIAQQQSHIVSMTKNEQGMTQLRIFNYESKGVEFSVGTMYKEIVEGIWGNLNCELLYLTSDDDERFSIQHDRYLMRNIVTQCANSPLGYSVYNSTFRINIFKNFSIEQL